MMFHAVLPISTILLIFGFKSEAKIADTTYQIATNAFRGEQNAQILKIKFNISGHDEQLTKFYFSTRGSTNTSDISQARLFYTGNSDLTGNALSLSNIIGASVSSPGGSLVFSVNKALSSGDNYFFLTYDVSPNANASDVLDATLDSVRFSDTLLIVKNGNPPGARLIDYYANYCNVSVLIPNSVSKQYIGVTDVSIGNQVNNVSTDLDRLTFYPTQHISVYRQESYPVKIKYGEGHNEQIIGWVDWNNDGIIDTSTETVFYTKSSPSAETYTANLFIPCSATSGSHKLRIESDIDTIPKLTPCGNLRYGNAQEYIIDVQSDVFPSQVSFSTDSPKFQGSPIIFTNNSNAHGNVKREWCFSNTCLNNNNAKFDAVGDTVAYTWTQSAGKGVATYAVKMRLTWQGCDSTVVKYYTDSVKVIPPTLAPVTAFIASQNTADTTTIIQLTDLSTNKSGSWYWQIEPSIVNGSPSFSYLNGTTYSSQNPVLRFNHTGKYDVSLTAHNGKGLQTNAKKDFFNIMHYARMCSGTDTLTASSGFLYADGGKDHPYGNNKSCFIVIKPPCATAIKISFNSFDVSTYGAGHDNLKIFDSTNAKGRSLTDSAGYPNGFQNANRGNAPQLPPSVTANTGTAFLQWTTDSSFTAAGFEAIWTSTLRTSSPPKASFIGPDTVYIHHTATFTNLSSGPELHFFWDLNGDGASDNFNENPHFTYDSTGIFHVRLIAQNCGGIDTFFKTIVVVRNNSAPVANFKTAISYGTNDIAVGTGDPVQFLDISTQNPYKWLWKVKPLNKHNLITYLNSDSTSQNPVVQFPDPGLYSVSLTAINEKGSSTITKDSFVYVQQYCTPIVASPVKSIGISKVFITDRNGDTIINHSSTCGDTGYNAYLSANPPQLIQNDVYHVTISRDTAIGNMTGMLWLDYSKQGVFDQVDDTLLVVQNISGKTWSGTFQLRRIATGECRLRVGVSYYGKSIDACGINPVGEFEDYNVLLQKDTLPPVIHINGKDTVIVEEQNPYNDAGATVYDDAEGNISYKLITSDTVNTSKPGIYYVTYNASDFDGNKAKEVIRVVKVIGDTARPLITLNDSQVIFVEVYNGYTEYGATVRDNIDTGLSVQISGTIDTLKTGIYYINYTSTDHSGNKAVVLRKVIVGDTIKPVIKLLGSPVEKLQVLTSFIDSGVVAADNYTRHLIMKIQRDFDSSKIGTGTIIYTATDSAGNSASVTRTIIVNNYIPPKIRLPFDTLFVEVNRNFTLPNPIMSSIYYPVSKLQDTICYRMGKFSDPIKPDKYKLGATLVMFVARDPSHLVSDTAYLVVDVVDREAPIMYFNVDTMVYLKRWQRYDPGFHINITDNCDPQPFLVISGTFKNTDNPGNYYLNYQAEDHSGNKSKTLTRWFIVEDSYSGLSDSKPGDNSFSYFPNPALSKVSLNYSSPEAVYISLDITDVLGRNVKPIYTGTTSSLNLETNISSLPSGIYFINLVRNEKTESYKLIITK